MKPPIQLNVRGPSPDILDVAHLWKILTHDLIRDLKFGVEPYETEDGQGKLRLSIYSQRYDDDHPAGYDHCWAMKEFSNNGYLISWGQLLDLLIVAHRAILAHFARYNLH